MSELLKHIMEALAFHFSGWRSSGRAVEQSDGGEFEPHQVSVLVPEILGPDATGDHCENANTQEP